MYNPVSLSVGGIEFWNVYLSLYKTKGGGVEIHSNENVPFHLNKTYIPQDELIINHWTFMSLPIMFP